MCMEEWVELAVIADLSWPSVPQHLVEAKEDDSVMLKSP